MNGNEQHVQRSAPVANGRARSGPTTGVGELRSRVLTVDQALPYSTLASVVPFNSGAPLSLSIVTSHVRWRRMLTAVL
jgi:hypothetical protein